MYEKCEKMDQFYVDRSITIGCFWHRWFSAQCYGNGSFQSVGVRRKCGTWVKRYLCFSFEYQKENQME